MNFSRRNIATAGATALIVLAGVFGIKSLIEKIKEQSDSEIVLEEEVVTLPDVGAYPIGSASFNHIVHTQTTDGSLGLSEAVQIPVSITFYGALDDEAAVEGERKGVAYIQIHGGVNSGQKCTVFLEYKVDFKVEGTFFPRDCTFKLKLLAEPKDSKVAESTCGSTIASSLNMAATSLFIPPYYGASEIVISKGNWDSKAKGYFINVESASSIGKIIWEYGLKGFKLPSGVGCGF